MDANTAIDLARQAVTVALLVGAPVLLAALAVGLVVAMLQALTQIQEHTLSFVPKVLAVAGVLLLAGPWMLQRLIEFSGAMFTRLP